MHNQTESMNITSIFILQGNNFQKQETENKTCKLCLKKCKMK